MFYCDRFRWLNVEAREFARASTGASKMRKPKPFTVFQPVPGQTFPKPLFVIHAYSLAQARALVAAKVAGETIVVGPV
jgi:hypothetical protein